MSNMQLQSDVQPCNSPSTQATMPHTSTHVLMLIHVASLHTQSHQCTNSTKTKSFHIIQAIASSRISVAAQTKTD